MSCQRRANEKRSYWGRLKNETPCQTVAPRPDLKILSLHRYGSIVRVLKRVSMQTQALKA